LLRFEGWGWRKREQCGIRVHEYVKDEDV